MVESELICGCINWIRVMSAIVVASVRKYGAFHGHPDAHETVKQLTLRADKEKKSLMEIVKGEKELTPYLEKFSAEQKAIISDPEKYLGLAEKKTELLCSFWKKELGL